VFTDDYREEDFPSTGPISHEFHYPSLTAWAGRMATSVLLAMSISCNLGYPSAVRADDDWGKSDPAAKLATQTPIKHVVVIFDENNSFDHYFGTYPNALNLPGETSTFYPAPDTPQVMD